jgi:hypothetical protein
MSLEKFQSKIDTILNLQSKTEYTQNGKLEQKKEEFTCACDTIEQT